MWKCIFSILTNRGVGCNREPIDGEFARDIHPSECAWFMSEPSKYKWDGSKMVEVDAAILNSEKLEKDKAAAKLANSRLTIRP